ncbi:unnamed protein product [Ostreobium quekettii]|uniref:Uncharacterized protein n=1 Tax=Ostreobium quekettii TaxID=121088 RepID=A0A8S1IQF2_9CHLO|nr:unnamed protein product [Ostreobium quekettii]
MRRAAVHRAQIAAVEGSKCSDRGLKSAFWKLRDSVLKEKIFSRIWIYSEVAESVGKWDKVIWGAEKIRGGIWIDPEIGLSVWISGESIWRAQKMFAKIWIDQEIGKFVGNQTDRFGEQETYLVTGGSMLGH